jgi:hypothetical protein
VSLRQATADTSGHGTTAAPADVAREQLDSALLAELPVPVPPPHREAWGRAVVPCVLLALLASLFWARLAGGARRGARVTERRAAGTVEPTQRRVAAPAGAGTSGRALPPGVRPVALPPEVAAFLARAEARGGESAVRPREPVGRSPASRPAATRAGLDFLIDR